MQSEILDIRRRIFGGKQTSKEDIAVVTTMIRIMKEFNFTLNELKKLPLPTYRFLIEYINEEDKEIAKRSRKGRKK